MPNHVTNRLRVRGATEWIERLWDAVKVHHARTMSKDYDDNTICQKKNIDNTIGWYDEVTGKLVHRQGRALEVLQESGPLPDDWERMYEDAWDEHICFSKIVPPPDTPEYRDEPTQEEAKSSPDWWYTWNCNNWGTKWGAYEQKRPDSKTVLFDTAWSPPDPVMLELSAKFPMLTFTMESVDEGWNFTCITVFEDGKAISRTDIPCSKDNAVFCKLCFELKGYDPRNEEEEEEEEDE